MINVDRYDAGELDATAEPIQVMLSKKEAQNVLIYPKIDCYMTLNGSAKEIFLPALAWTPISIVASAFSIRAIEDGGKVYWQAWYI